MLEFYFFYAGSDDAKECAWFFLQEIEATVVDGNGTETGHIIVTTIGGKNGQPKQVFFFLFWNCHVMYSMMLMLCCDYRQLATWLNVL